MTSSVPPPTSTSRQLEALDAYGMGCRWCLIIDELVVFASLRGVVAPATQARGSQGPVATRRPLPTSPR